MNVALQRPPSLVVPTDEIKGVWPKGAITEMRGGKKGDVLKLVCFA